MVAFRRGRVVRWGITNDQSDLNGIVRKVCSIFVGRCFDGRIPHVKCKGLED